MHWTWLHLPTKRYPVGYITSDFCLGELTQVYPDLNIEIGRHFVLSRAADDIEDEQDESNISATNDDNDSIPINQWTIQPIKVMTMTTLWIFPSFAIFNVRPMNGIVCAANASIIIHDKGDNPISFKFNGTTLSQVQSTKCLGVIIDESLSWHEHIDHVCKNVIASLSMLRHIRPFLGVKDLSFLYNCLIQSQLDYCCEVWGSQLRCSY